MNCSEKQEKSVIVPQCQYFVVRKKRLCRMTVRPGGSYCGEHDPQPISAGGQGDPRVPCPNDPKHTCYASKLEKHLSICNARLTPPPPYIITNVNAPPPPAEPPARLSLALTPPELVARVVDKVNKLYLKHVESEIIDIPEPPIHPAVAAEFATDRGDASRRHLRQASALLHIAEGHQLVRPNTCYVELGAGKGQLSYFAGVAWCAGTDGSGDVTGSSSGSRLLVVDRAALRHKRDNKLRREAAVAAAAAAAAAAQTDDADGDHSTAVGDSNSSYCTRLRADLAHLSLSHTPAVQQCEHVVGIAKHLCGVATDYALRCVLGAGQRAAGLVLATCCHHRCQPHALLGRQRLTEVGISDEELDVVLGVVSWATSGDGWSRERRRLADPAGRDSSAWAARESTGRRAKALLDWARATALTEAGLRAHLCRFVPADVSPENLCIVAVAHAHAHANAHATSPTLTPAPIHVPTPAPEPVRETSH